MCGRFASTLPLEQVARLFGITGELPNIAPDWNTAPTQSAAKVRRHYFNGERCLFESADLAMRAGRRWVDELLATAGHPQV
jgi:hypothetical protein